MHQSDRYYRHSGSITPAGPLTAILIGSMAALVLGALYGYAIAWIPLVYINFLFTLGFGAALGLATGLGAQLGKMRNNAATAGCGLAVGLIGMYVAWVGWFHAYSDGDFLPVDPSQLFGMLGILTERGAWSIFGGTPTGIVLILIWLIEAAIVIGGSSLLAMGMAASTPFCERCNAWINDEQEIGPLQPLRRAEVIVASLERGDFSPLTALGRHTIKRGGYTRLTLRQCAHCQDSQFLSVSKVTLSRDDQGKRQEESKTILENLIIDREQYATLANHWRT